MIFLRITDNLHRQTDGLTNMITGILRYIFISQKAVNGA